MSMLLEDLAAETTDSLRRVADRLARELADPADAHLPAAVASARQATALAVARLAEAEAVWDATPAALQPDPLGPASVPLLRSLLGVYEGGGRLCRLARDLWARAAALGATPDPAADLGRVQARFDRMAHHARKAIDHRENGWQPADPERLARGMQEAREGKTVPAAELMRRFGGK